MSIYRTVMNGKLEVEEGSLVNVRVRVFEESYCDGLLNMNIFCMSYTDDTNTIMSDS